MITNPLAKEIEDIVNKGLESTILPYVNGNTIKIKNYVVQYKNDGEYTVYNSNTNEIIACTRFKSSAIAIAKRIASGFTGLTREIVMYDIELSKHCNDAIFYRNAMRNSKDSMTREIRSMRLEQAISRSRNVRRKIERHIFGI